MAYIKLYFATDNSAISEAPSATKPVTFVLRADLDEVGDGIRLYALAEAGYQVTGTTVTPTGNTSAKWALAPDAAGSKPGEWGDYGVALSLGSVGPSSKVYFWARAKATSDEVPINDVSVTLVAAGVAEKT